MTYMLQRWPVIRRSTRKQYRRSLRVLRLEPLPEHRRSYERRVYAHAEPLPLEIAGRRKVIAYACGHCGSVQSLKENAFNKSPVEAWRRALECCRRPTACTVCGTSIRREAASMCERCWARKRWTDDRARARKAEVVADTGDPVCDPFWSGEWGDGYSPCLAAHLDWWEDEYAPPEGEAPAEDAPEPPAFVYATTPIVPAIEPDTLLERLSEELHEDADAADLDGVDALLAAVDTFNKAQRAACYMIDYSRVIVINPARFAAYLETDWDGTPDIRWRIEPRGLSPLRDASPGAERAPEGPES